MLLIVITSSAQDIRKPSSSLASIETHLQEITKTEKSRNYKNIKTLNYVADYIHKEFLKHCDTVYTQPYLVNGVTYKNVIGVLHPDIDELIVIGAHYDVAGSQEGADDNASGVTGLLELSRLLARESLNHRIEFVAYTLEEPPFFRTKQMGSYVHAKHLFDKKSKVIGMICLEMIGFFRDEENSQQYPIPSMKSLYGSIGNYITVVHKTDNGTFGKYFIKRTKENQLLETKSFLGIPGVSGVDFSDHLNYWNFGYSAIMITDTAMFRNMNYHRESDTMETLDINKMKLVIDQLYLTVKSL
ncbi:M28 family peptidase [Aquimarina addita]|uniref:M28 family peptidase n=2 Tax=Aquimarina addita TaxID=870485 RepID=A0ABP7XF64_9FLAO